MLNWVPHQTLEVVPRQVQAEGYALQQLLSQVHHPLVIAIGQFAKFREA